MTFAWGLGPFSLLQPSVLSPGELQTSSPVTQEPEFTEPGACYANIHCHKVVRILYLNRKYAYLAGSMHFD